MSVSEHFDVGFATINIGSDSEGLQLLDRTRNEYIDCNPEDAFIWIGAICHEISNGDIPVDLHRVKWNKAKRQSTIYEISVGNQIECLSYNYGCNWIELPMLGLSHSHNNNQSIRILSSDGFTE